MTVRLVDGPTDNEGKVEVYYSDQWNRVCGDRWNITEAEVVCRELSFGRPTQAFYGSGSFQECLRNVNCVGTELTIAQCRSDDWYYGFSETDAGVICAGK